MYSLIFFSFFCMIIIFAHCTFFLPLINTEPPHHYHNYHHHHLHHTQRQASTTPTVSLYNNDFVTPPGNNVIPSLVYPVPPPLSNVQTSHSFPWKLFFIYFSNVTQNIYKNFHVASTTYRTRGRSCTALFFIKIFIRITFCSIDYLPYISTMHHVTPTAHSPLLRPTINHTSSTAESRHLLPRTLNLLTPFRTYSRQGARPRGLCSSRVAAARTHTPPSPTLPPLLKPC